MVIAAQSGIAGSTKIGKRVMMGGRSGAVDHIEIGDEAVLSGNTVAVRDVKPGERITGFPPLPHRAFLRFYRFLKKRFG